MGCMISNTAHVDTVFQSYKTMKPQWFTTYDAEQYYNAWKEVSGESITRKVLGAWHVDSAWQRASAYLHDTCCSTNLQ